MAFTSTVAMRSQLVAEVTPGTTPGSPVWKRMPLAIIMPHEDGDTTEYIGQGYKIPSGRIINKEWTTWTTEGAINYGDIAYFLAAVLQGGVSPSTTDTSARTWVFTPSLSNPDTLQTYSLQHGNDSYGWQANYMFMDALTLNFTRTEAKFSGGGKAQLWTLSPSMGALAGVTTLNNVPVLPNQVSLYLDTAFGSIGTTQYTGDFSCEIALSDRWGEVWTLDGTKPSFAGIVEKKPKLSVKLEVNADSVSDAFTTQWRADATKYLQIKATSTQLAGAATAYYSLIINIPLAVQKPGALKDSDGVYQAEWELGSISDPTAGYFISATSVNKLSAL